MEVQGARKDSSLKAFEGLSASELSSNTDFYSAMVGTAAYDRTIFIKLAMALQTDLMIRGLVEELQISAKNSVSNSCHPSSTRMLSLRSVYSVLFVSFYWLVFKYFITRFFSHSLTSAR